MNNALSEAQEALEDIVFLKKGFLFLWIYSMTMSSMELIIVHLNKDLCLKKYRVNTVGTGGMNIEVQKGRRTTPE